MTTAAKAVKAAGMKSLAEVSEITGIGRETLRVWNRDRPRLFGIILSGCIAEKEKRENSAHNNLEKANESN